MTDGEYRRRTLIYTALTIILGLDQDNERWNALLLAGRLVWFGWLGGMVGWEDGPFRTFVLFFLFCNIPPHYLRRRRGCFSWHQRYPVPQSRERRHIARTLLLFDFFIHARVFWRLFDTTVFPLLGFFFCLFSFIFPSLFSIRLVLRSHLMPLNRETESRQEADHKTGVWMRWDRTEEEIPLLLSLLFSVLVFLFDTFVLLYLYLSDIKNSIL